MDDQIKIVKIQSAVQVVTTLLNAPREHSELSNELYTDAVNFLRSEFNSKEMETLVPMKQY